MPYIDDDLSHFRAPFGLRVVWLLKRDLVLKRLTESALKSHTHTHCDFIVFIFNYNVQKFNFWLMLLIKMCMCFLTSFLPP